MASRLIGTRPRLVWAASLSVATAVTGCVAISLGTRGHGAPAPSPEAVARLVVDRAPISIAIRPWSAARRDVQDVSKVLAKTEPFFLYRRVADLLHLLELWGAEADFPGPPSFPTPPDARPVSGRDALAFLLLGEDFEAFYKFDDPKNWLLTRTAHGVREQVGDLPSLSPHTDNILAICAMNGLPLSTPVKAAGENFLLADLLADSLSRFDTGQEIEFSAVALIRYLPPESRWSDRFGREHNMEEIVEALLSVPNGQGVCAGTHVLSALATFYRVGESQGGIPAATLTRIEGRLQDFARLLERTQADDGSWSGHWWDLSSSKGDASVIEKIQVTSHHIEWMCLAPESCRVADRTAERASRLLLDLMTSLDESTLPSSRSYTPISHGAHALVMPHGCANAWQFRQGPGRGTR